MGAQAPTWHTARALRCNLSHFPLQTGGPGGESGCLAFGLHTITYCVILNKLLNLSCASVSQLCMGIITIPHKVVIRIQ